MVGLSLSSYLLAAVLFIETTTAATLPPSACTNIKAPTIPGAKVLSIEGNEIFHGIFNPFHPYFVDTVYDLNVCNVTVILSHPVINDTVIVQLFLPLKNWNGRFQATGGGGLSTSFDQVMISRGAKAGYASGRTNGGHPTNYFSAKQWALKSDVTVDLDLLENFATRSLHDLAVVGKAIIRNYYGKAPSYSYWNGCSTGGRSGLSEAQNYPEDFDGIMAAAPTVGSPSVYVSNLWPQVVFQNEGYVPSPCELLAFQTAAIEECDGLDGVKDGVISNLKDCHFDPLSIIGKKIDCGGNDITITRKTAIIAQKISEGPKAEDGSRLWWGLNAATDFHSTAMTTLINDISVGLPFPVAVDWVSLFVQEDAKFNITAITYEQYRKIFAESNRKYNKLFAIDDADLSPFRKAGGKMITWQGMADNLVSTEATEDYYRQVEKTVGKARTADFYRLFLAPGGGHCHGIDGPIPTDALMQLVEWVEKGVAPDTLPAVYQNGRGVIVKKALCRYPFVSKYNGKGNPNETSSYKCARSF